MIKSLDLRFVRNYDHTNIAFSKGINLFFGDNGVGKTTLLEAIHTVSTTKSFKTHKLNEIIHKAHAQAKIKIQLEQNQEITLVLQPKQKTFWIDQEKAKKQSDVLGHFRVITLTPEHHQVIQGNKQDRLVYFDQMIVQINPHYLELLKNHQKVLKHKRALLKQDLRISSYQDQAKVWNDQHLELSQAIRQQRQNTIETINQTIMQEYQSIAQNKAQINLAYHPLENESNLIQKEFYAKQVLTGQQKDQVGIYLDHTDTKRHASQGEKSTLLLALKFSQIHLFGLDQKPLFLLDDIGATLDYKRRKLLFEKIQNLGFQTMITTCDPSVVEQVQKICLQATVFVQKNQTWINEQAL